MSAPTVPGSRHEQARAREVGGLGSLVLQRALLAAEDLGALVHDLLAPDPWHQLRATRIPDIDKAYRDALRARPSQQDVPLHCRRRPRARPPGAWRRLRPLQDAQALHRRPRPCRPASGSLPRPAPHVRDASNRRRRPATNPGVPSHPPGYMGSRQPRESVCVRCLVVEGDRHTECRYEVVALHRREESALGA